MITVNHQRHGTRMSSFEVETLESLESLVPHNLKKAVSRGNWESHDLLTNTKVMHLTSLKGDPMGSLFANPV